MDSLSFSGSSKTTGSSTSKLSSLKDKEDGFRKDNSVSPIDLECGIQAERIQKILDLAVYKTKLALCLPLLMREKRTLTSVLKPQDYEEVSFIFEQYNSLLFSSSLMNMDAIDDIESGDCTLKERINPELGHLICILNSYKNLKPEVEAMVEKIRSDAYDPDWSKRRSVPQAFVYLIELEKFRDLVVIQTLTTAAEELQAAFNARKLAISNTKLMACVEEYSKNLKEEYENFDKAVKEKNNTIERLKREIAQLHQSANVTLNKKILDSERKMVLLSRTQVAKAEVLKEVEIESRETYERLLAKDIHEERNHRLRRVKVETQLLSWIQKYDLEMKVKQSELNEVTDDFDDETRQVEYLERKLEEQNKEFTPLMEEKEAEYHAEMTEKMNLFIIQHAARVIQMAWKETVANRAEKAKLRKIQKQQRAAAEVAAKAAEEAAKKEAAAAKKAAKEAKQQAAAERKAAKEAEKEAAKAAKAAKTAKEEEEEGL